jgi:voltage-gated potassium channel
MEALLRLAYNVGRLFRGLRVALREPEVQGVLALALALILLATIFYRLVEKWSLLDSAYFAVVTIATVGYGDFAPQTSVGKLFTIGYIFCGIGIFVAAGSSIAQAILRTDPQNSQK